MTKREIEILTAAIETYVESAEPVSSALLAGRYPFGLSSASIRTVLGKLEDEGYLYSPHTSAGRVPTEEAYRWYVTRSMERECKPTDRERQLVSRRVRELGGEQLPVPYLAQFMADMMQLATLTRSAGSVQFYGLSNIFRQPEFQSYEQARSFAEVVDHLDELTRDLPSELGVQVYVGADTPLGRGADYSLVVQRFMSPTDEPLLFGVLGPTRMPYPRVISLLSLVSDLMEDQDGQA